MSRRPRPSSIAATQREMITITASAPVKYWTNSPK
jgi:hypothetical protein